jgi:hypothetical protein
MESEKHVLQWSPLIGLKHHCLHRPNVHAPNVAAIGCTASGTNAEFTGSPGSDVASSDISVLPQAWASAAHFQVATVHKTEEHRQQIWDWAEAYCHTMSNKSEPSVPQQLAILNAMPGSGKLQKQHATSLFMHYCSKIRKQQL